MSMRPSRVSHLVAGRLRTRIVGDRWGRGRGGAARVARGACAVRALTVPLGAATARAVLLSQISSFGGGGSGAGQFQAPVGVAIEQSNGAVYVADSGHARVEKFDANGNFVAAWGWGIKDGKVQSEVCTSNCLAGIAGSGRGQFSRPTSIAVGASGSPSAGKVTPRPQRPLDTRPRPPRPAAPRPPRWPPPAVPSSSSRTGRSHEKGRFRPRLWRG